MKKGSGTYPQHFCCLVSGLDQIEPSFSMRVAEQRKSKDHPSLLLNPIGGTLLALVVFLFGLFLGASVAKADPPSVKYVSLSAKVVLFPGESQEHGYQRIARIVGEANKHALSQLIQIELSDVSFVPAPQNPTMVTVLRDFMTSIEGTLGSGTERRAAVLFTSQAYGGEEGRAIPRSGCTDAAVAVVAVKSGIVGDFPQHLIVSAGRTLAHEFLHIWGADHDEHLLEDPATGALVASLMHPYAVGTFAVSQKSLDEILNYITSIEPGQNCLRDAPEENNNSFESLGLGATFEVIEGESKQLQLHFPGSPPDFETCALELDDSALPFSAVRQLVDAASGVYSLNFALDTTSNGESKTYPVRVKLICANFTSEQNYQIIVRDKDRRPVIRTAQNNFLIRSGRRARVAFTVENPAEISGSPKVVCKGLPRGVRLKKRGNAYNFSVRPSRRGYSVSCQATNSEGTSAQSFNFRVLRPIRR